jgi:hypothetical protein
MRLTVSLLLLSALFLTSCANQGVIVQKESRAHPFYESVGIEGVYTFMLRDDAGVIHRQMVTPEVYERYAVGERFNDELPTPATNDATEPKAVQIAMHRPTFAVGRMASATKTVKVQHVAVAKAQTATKSKVAKRSTQSATKHIATRGTHKKTSHAQVASRSRTRAKLVAARSKKSKTVAVATKVPKPWKLTAPTVESAISSQPAPPAEGPPAAMEAPLPKPTPRQTQVDIPDAH